MSESVTITTIFSFVGVPNRGRDGQPKSLNLGGLRQYMSPQAFRAAMRDQTVAPLVDVANSKTVRSRVSLQRKLLPALLNKGVEEEFAKIYASAVAQVISGADEDGAWSAPIVLGQREIDAIVKAGVSLLEEFGDAVEKAYKSAKKSEDRVKAGSKVLEKKMGASLKKAIHNTAFAGTEAIIFGRMVTNPNLPRVDGALATSMALGVGPLQVAHDYFITRDELTGSTEGAAHMNIKPISSGTFVQENVIDLERLRRQLPEEDHAAIVEWIVRASALAPTKLARAGSTAPAGASEVIVTVAGASRSTMEAFMLPADIGTREAAERALEALQQIDRLYGSPDLRVTLTGSGSLDALASAIGDQVRASEAARAE